LRSHFRDLEDACHSVTIGVEFYLASFQNAITDGHWRLTPVILAT
jgi:hypothetical protein